MNADRSGKGSTQANSNTVDALLDAFLERHVREKLRTAKEFERIFDKYVRPHWSKSIYDLRRHDIVEMLDAIEVEHGPVMADRTLARVRKAFFWYSAAPTPSFPR